MGSFKRANNVLLPLVFQALIEPQGTSSRAKLFVDSTTIILRYSRPREVRVGDVFQQVYNPVAGNILLSALVAALPPILLAILLAVVRLAPWKSAIAAAATAFLLAWLVWGLPFTVTVGSPIRLLAKAPSSPGLPSCWRSYATVLSIRPESC